MDIIQKLLLWIHLLALVGGGASSVAMPAIGAQMAKATAEGRASLQGVARRVVMAGRGAMVVLLITGPLLYWLKWNFTAPSAIWFGIKMLFVLILVVAMIVGGLGMKRAMGGDPSGQALAMRMGMVSSISMLIIVLAAVFAFT